MKLLIFGGTTEGRLLAGQLAAGGHDVTVSCATELGAEELKGIPCRTLCGRLDTAQMQALAGSFDLVADATHPYSAVVSANIRAACQAAGVPLRRILRDRALAQTDGCITVRSCREAAEVLMPTEGRILLTTGSKELADYHGLEPERIFARILPTHAGIDACEQLGIPHHNILALQGPFSQKMNEACIEQYGIRWLVTRNSGPAGGFAEKIAAAQACGVRVILVERPEEHGVTMEEFRNEVNSVCRSN